MDAPPADSRDEIRALYAYWDSKRGARRMPARRDLDPIEIPRLLPHLFLVEVAQGRFVYRVFGTGLVALFGRDLTGRPVGDGVQPEALPEVQDRYGRVARDGTPVFQRTRLLERFNNYAEVERLMLPLAPDGVGVDQILGMTIRRLEP